MTRTVLLSIVGLVALSTVAYAGAGMLSDTPAPLAGALGGPYGMTAVGLGYGAFRLYRKIRP